MRLDRKNLMIGLAAIIVVAIGVIFFVTNNRSAPTTVATSGGMTPAPTTTTTTPSMSSTAPSTSGGDSAATTTTPPAAGAATGTGSSTATATPPAATAVSCTSAAKDYPNVTPAAGTYSKADLDIAGPLGDKCIGSPDAPVTIIEYASMTCTHCQHFHEVTWPDLKTKYIDTGKVRFVLREFPLDPLAAVAIMVARCAPNDQFFPLVDLMFDNQKDWAFVENPVKPLFELVKQAGFTQESFDACWKNQNTLNGVTFVRNRGAEKFGINGTPTFFINGVKKNGAIELADIEATAGALLK